MTRDEARRVLARLHEAQGAFYAGGPPEPLHDVLTDDIVWVVPGTNAIAGAYRGLDDGGVRRDLVGGPGG